MAFKGVLSYAHCTYVWICLYEIDKQNWKNLPKYLLEENKTTEIFKLNQLIKPKKLNQRTAFRGRNVIKVFFYAKRIQISS